MEICHIVPSTEEQHGGPSKSVRALCGALACGNKVKLLTTARDGNGRVEEDDGGLREITFKRDWPDRICPSRALDQGLAQTRVDVVHHHSLWLRTLHYANRAARRSGATFVISPRGMMSRWAWEHHSGRKRIARHLIHPGALEAAHGWHATSAEEELEIRDRGFRQPVCVAPNGVREPTPADIVKSRERWRELWPETAARPVALFYSRFHSKKRVRELLELWPTRAPGEWLLMLAGIPQEFTAADLQRFADATSGRGRVRVFDGLGEPPPYGVASLHRCSFSRRTTRILA
jgi:glycosyltransferase involved in cell wall biosynthesis